MKLHYKSTGTGTPVIILHGLFGMLDNWQTFVRYLSEDYTVYTPDLRNHGRSPHDERFDYQVLAEDIREFIREHDLRVPVLIGHSLGGKTAMQVALNWPDLISKLIVIDIAPRAYPPGHDHIVEALQHTQPEKASSRTDVREQLMGELNNEGVVLFLMKNLARREDGTYAWRMNLPVLARDYEQTIAAIENDSQFTKPTLFVRGGKSAYVQDSDLDEIKSLFPSAQLITIADAGHWVHADAMEELLEITRKFLQ